LLSLSDDLQQHQIGHKAKNLSLLLKQGFAVPRGFVLTSRTQAQIADEKLKESIDSLGGFPVAVRSSSNLEDLDSASFAGLYESYLNVNSLEELRRRIEDCFQSSSSQRVSDYLEKKGIDSSHTKMEMGVLVQKMVNAKYSGVAFTLNPISGDSSEILVEYIEGLGEKLVSGQVTPKSISIDLDKKSSPRPAPFDLDSLERELLKVQAIFGKPQDVEWAINQDDKLYILQSRAITSSQFLKNCDEFTNADLKDGGVSSKVCTPMMYSLYQIGMKNSLPNYLNQVGLGRFSGKEDWLIFKYGRVYWNAGLVKRALMQIPDFDEEEFDKDLGISKDYGQSGPIKTPLTLKSLIRALPCLFKVNREYKTCLDLEKTSGQEFERQNKQWLKTISNFNNIEDEEFFHLFNEMKESFFSHYEPLYLRTVYNNANFQTDFKSFLKKIESKTHEKTNYLHLIDHIESISHMQIYRDLVHLKDLVATHGKTHPQANKARDKFFERHYHHGQSELDITVPRWGETPEIIDTLLEEVSYKHSSHQDLYRKELARLNHAIHKNCHFIERILLRSRLKTMAEKARQFIQVRESFRERSTKAYFIVRKFLLEAGKRLELGDDIFFYRIEEVGRIKVVKKIIESRRLRYHGYRNFEAPNEFGNGVIQTQLESLTEQRDGQIYYRGIACSSGSYSGKVRVITDLKDEGKLLPGDILVTKFTDPGWTPLLSKAGAVVTEVGGVLSHAAVIAREYGIPAVLNIPSITKILNEGQMATVDGEKGEVYVKAVDED
jgi:phosphohistidine swiveling domain-containing protein